MDRIPRIREESPCPCKSGTRYADCCMRFHYGRAKAATAEQLMRSRYSAYFFRLVDYLVDTTHPDTRGPNLRRELESTIEQARWQKLTVLSSSKGAADDKVGKVEFLAECLVKGEPHELREHSRFKRFKGAWKYLDDKG